MIRRVNADSLQRFHWFGLTILVGAVISGALSTDRRWMNWHFSRLGEGGTFSATIFNITLLVAAGLFYLFSRSLLADITKIKSLQPKNLTYSLKQLNGVFTAVTICIVAVAFFPFDKYPAVHNIFGYSMLFIFIYLCIFSSKIIPIFQKDFYKFGWFIIPVTVVCYILFLGFAAISLLVVESIIFSLIYIWLIQLIKSVEAAIKVDELHFKKITI